MSQLKEIILTILLALVYLFLISIIWKLLPIFNYIWLDYLCCAIVFGIIYYNLNLIRQKLITKN